MTAPKLRFKEFDGDWCLRTLGNTAEFVSGYAFDSEKFGENGRKLITPKNFTTNGKALFTKQNTKYTTEECDEKFVCSGNDLLVLLTDLTQSCELLGKPVLLNHTHEDILLNQRILKIQPDENVLNKVFLLNFLLTESYLKHIKETSTGTTVRHSSNKVLSKYLICYPSKEEQTKIASFLSIMDEKISQLTKKHELLIQYKQCMMQKLFSQQIRFKADDGSEFGEWEKKSIKDVAEVKGGKRIPKGYALVNDNTGHPYITVSDMNRSYSIDSKNIRYVPREVVDAIKRYTITDKDIFISVAGTLGIIGKIPTEFNGANLTENADKLTNLKCHQDFLIYLLDSGYLSELIESTATTSAQPKLALYAIEQLEIRIPCLEEQTKIANFLSAIDQKIEVVAEQIAQAKTWKKGLLQQMFV